MLDAPDARSSRDCSESSAESLWIPVLEQLEAELTAGADHSFDPHEPWTAPDGLPSLPRSLRDRATALHEGQKRRAGELSAERLTVLQHREALGAVPSRSGPSSSIYLDVSG